MKTLEEGDVVLCKVDKIVGTTVFVKIEDNGTGTIVTSEIAPGRIRNLRDYVVPNKKIVCRVLRIDKSGHADLSLRRVTAKEKKEVSDYYQKEKNLAAALKTVLKEKATEIIKKIKEKSSIFEFLEQVKTTPEILKKIIPEQEAEQLLKILKEKKEREVTVKKKFSLSSEAGDGIIKIKKILPEEATYIAAGKFSVSIKDKNYKDANHKVEQILQEIETKAKELSCEFSVEK